MKVFIYTLGIIILVGAGVFAYSLSMPREAEQAPGGEEIEFTQEMIESMKEGSSKLSEAPLTNTYRNEAYSFNFKYPEGLIPSSFPNPEFEGDIIILSDNKTGVGMQIIVSPFDEELTALTVERIKRDVPDMTIVDPQDVLLGDQGKGVAFLDGTLDSATRNVWFVANGFLYQITSPKVFDGVLKGILNSWVFE